MATELEHSSDLGFKVESADLNSLFEDAAAALTGLLIDSSELHYGESRTVSLSAFGLEELMFDWLSELIYLFDGEHLLFKTFSVEIVKGGAERWYLNALLSGEKIDPKRHQIRSYVKAITLHQLMVRELANGWLATVYVDV